MAGSFFFYYFRNRPIVGTGANPDNPDCEGGSGAVLGCNPTGNAATGCDEGVAATSDCFNGTSV
ncbi:hypothetical protein A2291_07940 [candidate division WOR-1 bacterium RIFOXYB2_FULL_42_35]|uniref:Uncharacterized protein n=1 Tax=candidate division WOR-1 bacterium RIFOXYC2_FULL_41_25 TaxID=1802586 RepID=A0A1F4TK66_UNCSA|nr:MAG: hypothetical protein A2247_02100 [candidate division WOR-1 bacterium RIFOXYA2_FULL_41_14]OGC24020.1 MAG: hypothetical protein A2291_07940 [candidate division WOR-1 bacterium RIFOXYB2_FULL_42_35]OGC32443.1 MAG: hypothetical protein A2462_00040 [candidate division WOR-1 bacterium RIFOXYC2_FULL_41_25]